MKNGASIVHALGASPRARAHSLGGGRVSPPSPMCVERVVCGAHIKRFFILPTATRVTSPAAYVYRVYVPVELHPR